MNSGGVEGAAAAALAAEPAPGTPAVDVVDVFARPVRDYVYQYLGRPVNVLQAGCLTPVDELALDKLKIGRAHV